MVSDFTHLRLLLALYRGADPLRWEFSNFLMAQTLDFLIALRGSRIYTGCQIVSRAMSH